MTSVLQYRDPLSSSRSYFMSTPNLVSPMASIKRTSSYDGHSSGSDSRKQLSQPGGAKRRPSRAGTRSVTTLTAAQLERKRANDREAQRAIRQRTKDHIENLERQIAELRAQQDNLAHSSTKFLELMRRNEELENENTLLRTRLSHAVAALGVSDCNAANVMPGDSSSGMLSATASASPSDRIQALHQPRRSSTGTARSVTSVPDQATPVSQTGHWQQQHQQHQQHQSYASSVSSPHLEHPPSLGDVAGPPDAVRWSPHPNQHPHPQQHPATMAVPDPSLHAMDGPGMPYQYVVDANSRAITYPLEHSQLVTSQPMQQMTGYGTPTSNPSPHPQDYQRPMSVPINGQQSAIHTSHPHTPQQASGTFQSYASHAHQSYPPQVSHPGDMQMMAQAPHGQPQMMGDQGAIMYHMQPNMKIEQH